MPNEKIKNQLTEGLQMSLESLLSQLADVDAIMQPNVGATWKEYVKLQGKPEDVVRALSGGSVSSLSSFFFFLPLSGDSLARRAFC